MSVLEVINLGTIKAIFDGVNPPINQKVLWYDENPDQKVLKYFNTTLNSWINLASSIDGTGVSSFNARTGDVFLTSPDVIAALGYTPLATISANNGLTLTGSNLQLGGTLVKNTTINTSTFTLGVTGKLTVSSAPVSSTDVLRLQDIHLNDQILSGLTLSLSSGNVIVQAGTWRISNVSYAKGSSTTLALDVQDATLSRFDVIYADTSNGIHLISGTLSLSPDVPAIPSNSIEVGTILITPTSVTAGQTPPITDYVNTTTNQSSIHGQKQFLDKLSVQNDVLITGDLTAQTLQSFGTIQARTNIRFDNTASAGFDYYIGNGNETSSPSSLRITNPGSSAGVKIVNNDIFDIAGNLFLKKDSAILTSSSTTGYVWTATNTTGSGSWQAPSGGGSSNTFSNGLTDDGSGNITLGGTLVSPGFDLNLANNSVVFQDGNSGTESRYVQISGGITLEGGRTGGTTHNYGIVNVNTSNSTIYWNKAVSGVNLGMGITFGSGKINIFDRIFLKGLEYENDYSTNFTARSLIDKGYADAHYASTTTAFSLTTTGTTGIATYTGGVLNIPNYANTTYSAGTGLTLTSTTFSVNTSQNITTLSNLTSNGLVKTSGGTGTLSTATAGTDYQVPISVTTTGTLGAATLTSGVLNIPRYDASFTANNGITLSSNTFGLGGTLSTSKTISLGNNILAIHNSAGGITTDAGFSATYGHLQIIDASNNSAGVGVGLDGSNNALATIGISVGSNTTSLTKTAGTAGFIITDTQDLKGISYSADYSVNFTARSLVDKAYVDSRVSTGITLTTTGTTGPATLVSGTLNIPQYSGTSYTFSTGLTNTSGTITVNTSQNISTLSNLTSNGLIKTSGGTGALSIATSGTDYVIPAGNVATATALATPRAINGVNFDGTAAITVAAAAGTLTGTTLNSSILTSSLTTVGTITSGVWSGTAILDTKISSASTWNAKQGPITLTTTGSPGVATFSSNTLNIPSSAYTAGSGMTVGGGVITLGGGLLANSSLFLNGHSFEMADGSGSSFFSFQIGGATPILMQVGDGVAAAPWSQFTASSGNLTYITYIGATPSSNSYGFTTSTTQSSITYNTSSGSIGFQVSASNGALIFDSLNSAGASYAADYSANYTARSLVDKAYVDSVSGGINPMTTLGDIIYGGASGVATRLAGNTTSTRKFLTQTGTGTVSAAPAYFDLFATANTWSGVQALGSSTATTQSTADNSTKIATTAFVQANFTATAINFAPGLFSGAGTSVSPYDLGTDTVGIPELSATGTPSSTTYLRGDNTWATISGVGVSVIGTFSASSQTNGASIASTTITFGPADATNPGMMTTGTQTIAGTKNFSTSVQSPIFQGNSATFDIVLKDGSGNNAFRSGNANAWADTQATQFFQVGASTGKAFFSAFNGTIHSRLGFSSGVTQFTTGSYLTTPAPAGIFDVNNGTSSLFNITSTGQTTGGLFLTKATSTAAINATATATSTQLATGVITSTSAAATTITLPTATAMATQVGAIQGTSFNFTVDNSAGANAVTLVLGTGMVALTIITGGGTLSIAAGSVGIFKLYFKSTTTAAFVRLG
jgi:hypothetical protein